jgi:hypothetical protein
MAVDKTLIQGAAFAAAPLGVQGQEISTAINKVAQAGLNYMVAKKANYDIIDSQYRQFAENVLDYSGLQGEEFSLLYDQLMEGKDDYIQGNAKDRSMKIRELQVLANDYDSYKKLREHIAVNLNTLSPNFTTSEEGEDLIDALEGEGKALTPKNGRLGLKVGDNWMSMTDLGSYIQSNSIDINAKNSLADLNSKIINNKSYNTQGTSYLIDNWMQGANKHSLIYDNITGQGSYYSKTVTDLQTQTYDEVYGPGTNIAGEKGDQLVSKQDALTIVDSIVNSPGNKSLLDKELNKFFTDNTNGKFTSTRPVKTDDDDDDEEGRYILQNDDGPTIRVNADEREVGKFYADMQNRDAGFVEYTGVDDGEEEPPIIDSEEEK